MGIFFDGATEEQINDQAAREAVNSVGNDSLAAFMSAALSELVGRGIKNLQINPNLTIKEAAIQMDQLVWASKHSFLQTTASHLQTLYDQTANQWNSWGQVLQYSFLAQGHLAHYPEIAAYSSPK